ncbi:3'(2'),5'-bisphosphate nucleotidase [bacterium]|nr:3'(2'),5'-bisphosphate nucleotidase [bacterium]
MSAPHAATPYAREAAVALEAVRRAGHLCRSVQDGLDPGVLQKQDRSPVTVADFGSQALVCRMLAEAFPDDPVIGEENADALRQPDQAALLEQVTGHVRAQHPDVDAATVCDWIDRGGRREGAPRFWTLDPIDGTKGFLRGEHYAVALALIVDGAPVVAALACPNLGPAMDADRGDGTVFTAVRGDGTRRWTLTGGDGAPARVSDLARTSGLRFCQSVEAAHSSHDDAARIAERLGVTAPGVKVDSQVKYGTVARGDADAYLRLPKTLEYREKIWDHAAGALVVEEAGGRVSDIAGRPLDFGRGYQLEGNLGVIVTNGHLHQDVLAAVKALGIPGSA